MGQSQSSIDDSQVIANEYKRHINDAVAILAKASFGASPEKGFDASYWEKISDKDYGYALKLKVGFKASKAIAEIFKNIGKWSFDCAEFVQLANLYVINEIYESLDDAKTRAGGTFLLRQHNSTGLSPKSPLMYQRDKATDSFIKFVDEKAKAIMSNKEEDLLASMRVGSRIAFCNPVGDGTSFHNENTVKVGADQYAAHGLGKPNIFTRQQIIDGLSNFNTRSERESGKEQIFVRTMEVIEVDAE